MSTLTNKMTSTPIMFLDIPDLHKIGIGIGLNQTINRPSWDEYFLKICQEVATRSHDANTQFGCLFVRDKAIICTGYNGFPSGSDDDNLPNSRDINKYKLLFLNHAEESAIYYAARKGISLEGCTFYCLGHPCSACCRRLISVGVKDWVIGNKQYQADDQEILLREFLTKSYDISIRYI